MLDTFDTFVQSIGQEDDSCWTIQRHLERNTLRSKRKFSLWNLRLKCPSGPVLEPEFWGQMERAWKEKIDAQYGQGYSNDSYFKERQRLGPQKIQ